MQHHCIVVTQIVSVSECGDADVYIQMVLLWIISLMHLDLMNARVLPV